MSQTFSLVCHATQKKVWIGQGWGSMTTFYSGKPHTMQALADFLKDHMEQTLVLLCDDRHDEIAEYEEYTDRTSIERSTDAG